MANWILTIVCCVAFVELFVVMGTVARIKSLQKLIGKIGKVLSSPRISDHWKEIVLKRYALAMFLFSMRLLLALAVAASPFAAGMAVGRVFDLSFAAFLASTEGLIGAALFATVYVVVRSRVIR